MTDWQELDGYVNKRGERAALIRYRDKGKIYYEVHEYNQAEYGGGWGLWTCRNRRDAFSMFKEVKKILKRGIGELPEPKLFDRGGL